ncbi:MAG: murein L,D-transpeptidase catalytic domain family protein [Flavobacteriia bacterium]|nr:murein L,D-transpeptidase catalytic domain family protein [Flavobacteriia bacterium]
MKYCFLSFAIFILAFNSDNLDCFQNEKVNELELKSFQFEGIKKIEGIKKKSIIALKFCKEQKMNEDFCILIDMSLHSGKKRFYVWDFKKDTIISSCLVAHGCGQNPWSGDYSKDSPKFSNVDGSHLSSLGKYKIGQRGSSDWGIKLKFFLYGLEASNSNAFKRTIVFHSWEAVSDSEVFPNGTPEGWGCPTVSNNTLKILDPMLSTVSKNVLMWIYY